MRILLVEDEKSLSMALCELLRCEGFLCDAVYNGEDGLDNALSGVYDVIVLDIMLPKMNGLEVLSRLRAGKIGASVLMLTAKSDKEDIISGLKNGADDYLTKPFDTDEFLARVWALSRRTGRSYIDDSLKFGDISLSRTTHSLEKDGKAIQLSSREYQIMELLLQNQKNIVSKENMIVKIWGYDSDMEYNGPEVYITFLRRKLKALQSCINIKAVRGAGYCLEDVNA